jgi:hypothetical protein
VTLWTGFAVGVALFVSVVSYAMLNAPVRTRWHPFDCFDLFVPMAVVGLLFYASPRRHAELKLPILSVLTVGFSGVLLVYCLWASGRWEQLPAYQTRNWKWHDALLHTVFQRPEP